MESVVSEASLDGYRGRRVLVTGDTGFKGSWLALWLNQLGAEVTGFALPAERPEDHFAAAGLARVIHHIDGDIRDAEAVSSAFSRLRPEFVFHLAAQSLVRRSYADPRNTFDTNVSGSVNILEAVRLTPSVVSLVYVTSDKCYRNREWTWGYRENDELGGRDPYSASKAAAELVFSSYCGSFFGARAGFGAASARAGNVIGGGDWAEDRLVPDCIRALAKNAAVKVRNPASIRPWQHVLDPLHGYLQLGLRLASEPAAFCGAWNFGPDISSATRAGEVASRVVQLWGGGRVEHANVPNAPHEAGLLHLNSDKARVQLGWRSRWDLERTLAATVSWYREVGSGARPDEVSRRQLDQFMASGETAPQEIS